MLIGRFLMVAAQSAKVYLFDFAYSFNSAISLVSEASRVRVQRLVTNVSVGIGLSLSQDQPYAGDAMDTVSEVLLPLNHFVTTRRCTAVSSPIERGSPPGGLRKTRENTFPTNAKSALANCSWNSTCMHEQQSATIGANRTQPHMSKWRINLISGQHTKSISTVPS